MTYYGPSPSRAALAGPWAATGNHHYYGPEPVLPGGPSPGYAYGPGGEADAAAWQSVSTPKRYPDRYGAAQLDAEGRFVTLAEPPPPPGVSPTLLAPSPNRHAGEQLLSTLGVTPTRMQMRQADGQSLSKTPLKQEGNGRKRRPQVRRQTSTKKTAPSRRAKEQRQAQPTETAPSDKVIRLHRWYIAFQPTKSANSFSFRAEGLSHWIQVAGVRYRSEEAGEQRDADDAGENWHSSLIADSARPDMVQTKSGKLYGLVGACDEAMMRKKGFSDESIEPFRKGFPWNWIEEAVTEAKRRGLVKPMTPPVPSNTETSMESEGMRRRTMTKGAAKEMQDAEEHVAKNESKSEDASRLQGLPMEPVEVQTRASRSGKQLPAPRRKPPPKRQTLPNSDGDSEWTPDDPNTPPNRRGRPAKQTKYIRPPSDLEESDSEVEIVSSKMRQGGARKGQENAKRSDESDDDDEEDIRTPRSRARANKRKKAKGSSSESEYVPAKHSRTSSQSLRRHAAPAKKSSNSTSKSSLIKPKQIPRELLHLSRTSFGRLVAVENAIMEGLEDARSARKKARHSMPSHFGHDDPRTPVGQIGRKSLVTPRSSSRKRTVASKWWEVSRPVLKKQKPVLVSTASESEEDEQQEQVEPREVRSQAELDQSRIESRKTRKAHRLKPATKAECREAEVRAGQTSEEEEDEAEAELQVKAPTKVDKRPAKKQTAPERKRNYTQGSTKSASRVSYMPHHEAGDALSDDSNGQRRDRGRAKDLGEEVHNNQSEIFESVPTYVTGAEGRELQGDGDLEYVDEHRRDDYTNAHTADGRTNVMQLAQAALAFTATSMSDATAIEQLNSHEMTMSTRHADDETVAPRSDAGNRDHLHATKANHAADSPQLGEDLSFHAGKGSAVDKPFTAHPYAHQLHAGNIDAHVEPVREPGPAFDASLQHVQPAFFNIETTCGNHLAYIDETGLHIYREDRPGNDEMADQEGVSEHYEQGQLAAADGLSDRVRDFEGGRNHLSDEEATLDQPDKEVLTADEEVPATDEEVPSADVDEVPERKASDPSTPTDTIPTGHRQNELPLIGAEEAHEETELPPNDTAHAQKSTHSGQGLIEVAQAEDEPPIFLERETFCSGAQPLSEAVVETALDQGAVVQDNAAPASERGDPSTTLDRGIQEEATECGNLAGTPERGSPVRASESRRRSASIDSAIQNERISVAIPEHDTAAKEAAEVPPATEAQEDAIINLPSVAEPAKVVEVIELSDSEDTPMLKRPQDGMTLGPIEEHTRDQLERLEEDPGKSDVLEARGQILLPCTLEKMTESSTLSPRQADLSMDNGSESHTEAAVALAEEGDVATETAERSKVLSRPEGMMIESLARSDGRKLHVFSAQDVDDAEEDNDSEDSLSDDGSDVSLSELYYFSD